MEAELATIFDDIRILQIVQMCQLAAATTVMYDHIQSFRKEVSLIWKQPISLVTALYFVVSGSLVNEGEADSNLIVFISTSFSVQPLWWLTLSCQILFQFQVWGPFLSVWSTQVHRTIIAIMQLRIYAMYRKSWKILAATGIFFAMEIASISYVISINFERSLTYTNEPLPGLHMCSTLNLGKQFTAIYVPIFCFELILFCLAGYVVYKHMAKMRNIGGSRRLHATMRMIFKYSTLYFFVNRQLNATTLYLALPVIYLELTNSFLISVTIILGCRLVLNTRDFYSSSSDDDSRPDKYTFSQPSSSQFTNPIMGGHEMELSIMSGAHYSNTIPRVEIGDA
ncbi:hypothetical protein BU15DRAFT_58714 [Melanogaster broomeanus]|nr:hypothetical protein BU15DRAFT_58714 [Melanogaster broomeanus]